MMNFLKIQQNSLNYPICNGENSIKKFPYLHNDPHHHQSLTGCYPPLPSKKFVNIPEQLFELSCWQTNRSDKHVKTISLVDVKKQRPVTDA